MPCDSDAPSDRCARATTLLPAVASRAYSASYHVGRLRLSRRGRIASGLPLHKTHACVSVSTAVYANISVSGQRPEKSVQHHHKLRSIVRVTAVSVNRCNRLRDLYREPWPRGNQHQRQFSIRKRNCACLSLGHQRGEASVIASSPVRNLA